MAGALWPPGVIVLCWGLTEKMNRPSNFMVFLISQMLSHEASKLVCVCVGLRSVWRP